MKYLILIFSILSFKSLACESLDNTFSNNVEIWLGKKSEFSKMFNKSKCILDKEFKHLPVEKKKLIAKLILKSYQSEVKIENYSF